MSTLSQKIKSARCPRVSAVIVAGGSGTRFGADKLMAPLCGLPVIVRTLLAFERSPMITEIVIAARKDALEEIDDLARRYHIAKLAAVVPGGSTRLLSSLAGVLAASGSADVIAIHDGARPLVTERIIEDAVWGAYRSLAAAPAVPVRDTIRIARDGTAVKTPDRSTLFAVQTPQCFRRDIILAALRDAAGKAPALTDDCAAYERVGGQVRLTEGSQENIKITTPLDLAMAEIILEGRNGSCG